ncbi:MAG: uroporphyrinogen decarboxylase, partial [Chloroflexi bacterium]|nr:uroporphyrinogen decarboxylase [Chloroflexota bacterium]
LDYPVHAFNWDDRDETNAGLTAIWSETDKAVMGGVSRAGLGEFSADEIRGQASEAAGVGDTRVFVTGGCSIPPHTPHENRAAVAAGVRGN